MSDSMRKNRNVIPLTLEKLCDVIKRTPNDII